MNFAGMCQGMVVLGHHYLSQWENQQNMNFGHQHLVPAFFNGHGNTPANPVDLVVNQSIDLCHMEVSYGGTPESSILIGFSGINHPFWED